MRDTVNSLLAGAAAGCAATAPMTVVMEGVRRLLPRYEQDPIPPRQITEQAAAAVGADDDLSDDQKDGVTALAHFAFGASAGAVYGLVAPLAPSRGVVTGMGFGLAVWAGSYLGWLPVAGLYKHPKHEPTGRHVTMILSHLVWGAALGQLHGRLCERDASVATRGVSISQHHKAMLVTTG